MFKIFRIGKGHSFANQFRDATGKLLPVPTRHSL